MTADNKLTLLLNDVQKLSCAAGRGASWTREGRPLLRHPRAAGIPQSGAEQYATMDAETQILRHSEGEAREIPQAGAVQYVVVTCTNQQGDSRAERENDCVTEESASFPRQNHPGDSSVASGSL